MTHFAVRYPPPASLEACVPLQFVKHSPRFLIYYIPPSNPLLPMPHRPSLDPKLWERPTSSCHCANESLQLSLISLRLNLVFFRFNFLALPFSFGLHKCTDVVDQFLPDTHILRILHFQVNTIEVFFFALSKMVRVDNAVPSCRKGSLSDRPAVFGPSESPSVSGI